MERLDVTWPRTLKVWWSFSWRAALFSGVLGMILGFLAGVVAAIMGYDGSGGIIGGILGYLGSIPVSMWVMHIVLQKRFGEFTLVLVRNAD